jgi:DUF4097 and DUF4098 domain-containing protein YvlB
MSPGAPGLEVKMREQTSRYVVLVALLVATAGAVCAGQPVNESRPVAPGAEVSVENLAGSLTIEGSTGGMLEVTGVLGDGVEELDIDVDEEDGEIYIEVVFDEDYHGRQAQATELLIRLPADSPLSIETVSSSVTVSGMQSAVEIESVSGVVRVSGMPSSLEIENVSGSVQVETATSGSSVESVSGKIEIGTVLGDFDASNVSGNISIEDGTLGEADLETVSGNIKCHALPGSSGDIDMETMSGTITLLVDSGAAASYELSTFSGSILNDFGPEARRTSKYTPGKELSFNTGHGGPNISLTSFSGAIKLSSR